MKIASILPDDMFDFISLGAPFVVRGYGRLTGIDAAEIMKQKDSAQEHTLGYNDSFRMTGVDMCSKLTALVERTNAEFAYSRFWQHQKGHVTRWHYDGDGVQIFNLCLSGSKTYSIAPPDDPHFINYPFSNIVMIPGVAKFNVTLHVDDLLFFPPFWYHRVVCEEDDTITYNHCSFRHDGVTAEQAGARHLSNLDLHRMLRTKMGDYSTRKPPISNLLLLMPEYAMIGVLTLILMRLNVSPSLVAIPTFLLHHHERRQDSTHGVLFVISLICCLQMESASKITHFYPILHGKCKDMSSLFMTNFHIVKTFLRQHTF